MNNTLKIFVWSLLYFLSGLGNESPRIIYCKTWWFWFYSFNWIAKYCVIHEVGSTTQQIQTFINNYYNNNVYNTSMVLHTNTVYEKLHSNKKMSKGVSGIVSSRRDKQLERIWVWGGPQTEALKRLL